MVIKNRFAELHDEIRAWRQDFHQHPEIMFEMHRTAGVVENFLKEFGVDEVVTGVGRTGVVGVIHGKQNASGRVIGLRADMDALPMKEATNLPYASKIDGAMHACGHDGHTAMLLGAAKYLSETRQFDGSVVLIFQPAEEGGGGGKEMCDDGLMDRFGIQEVYAMHNWPGMAEGKFSIRSGAFFAAADRVSVIIKGQGGHAAKPHTTVDPTVIASHVILALQSIASRNVDPMKHVVVSMTSFETSSRAYNVIPDKVELRGTVRTMLPEVRTMAEQRIKDIARLTAEAYGATTEINFMPGYPVMVNSQTQTDFATKVAENVSGNCAKADAIMGGEDFSYMLKERPGAYILLGNGENSEEVHTVRYDFNDEIIPAGCSWFSEIAEHRMPLEH